MPDLYPLARRFLFAMDAESAHHATLTMMRAADSLGLLGPLTGSSPGHNPVTLMGLTFPNRVGLLFEDVELQPVEFLGMDASTLPPFAANLPKLPGTDNTSDSSTGPGYFDVSYLDDELLIIRQNAPGGLFALVKVTDSDP